MNKNTWIIIPVYNEGSVIRVVVEEALKSFENIVCVNDGSTDNTAEEIKKTKAHLVNHVINLGQGGALQTGIEYALLDPRAKYFVTFDADGQHKLDDVLRMQKLLEKGDHDIILGSRFLGEGNNIPALKRAILKAAILFTTFTTGLKLTDTHNGLRVFNRNFAEALNIRLRGMSHASEVLSRISIGKFKYTEVPVTIEYTEYSKAKGQSILNLINILFDLFIDSIRK